MNLGAAIVVFVLIWWCVFFAALPFGVRGGWEAPEDHVRGAEPGAPREPDLRRKAIVTTGITFVLWAVAVAMIMSGVVNFRD